MTQGTPFQQGVWAALRTIPRGEVRTYTDIAVQIGHPSSAGLCQRLRQEPRTKIEVPCHRISL